MEEIELKVLKKDGNLVKYDDSKVINALTKAFIKLDYNLATVFQDILEMADNITDILKEDKQLISSVEYIQDLVMNELLGTDYKDVAKEYISYATMRAIQKEEVLDIQKSINKVLNNDPTVVNENANKDCRKMATRGDLTRGQVYKAEGLKMLPTDVRNAHLKGIIHFHDLDYSPYERYSNCCVVNIEDMLKNGFELNNVKITQAKSLDVAVDHCAMIIQNVSTSQYGGTSLPNIDEVLVPYAEMSYEKLYKENVNTVCKFGIDIEDPVAKDILNKLTMDDIEKLIYNCMKKMEYKISSMSGHGSQQPFSTISFGRGTSIFARMIQKAILKVRINGLYNGRTAIFPKLTYFIEDGVNLKPDDINYDIKQLALECSSKRMYPDILNVPMVKKITGGAVVTPMGCRSFASYWEDSDGNSVVSGRQNMGVVTLNLPRIAIESGGSIRKFWDLMEERVELVHKALRFRIDNVIKARPTDAPILYKDGALGRLKDEDEVVSLYEGGRATVSFGYIGIYETVLQFYGSNWETDKKAKDFSINILKYMSDKCEEWYNKENYKYSLYSTPSESLTDRFNKLDLEKFGIIKDVTDKEYYTNSFHYDVRKSPNPFEKIDFEKDYPKYASGGFIHYIEYPNIKQNLKALEMVWDYSYDKVGYLGTNTPVDKCFECSYEGDFSATSDGYKCPNCGNTNPETCDVVKRLCGYLGNPQVRPTVKGRHKEMISREKHIK